MKDEIGEVKAELDMLEGTDEGKQNNKLKQMTIGRKKFNMDPKKGNEKIIFFAILRKYLRYVSNSISIYKGGRLMRVFRLNFN